MDLVLSKYYGDCGWSCGDTYESLKWLDTIRAKPTEEELNIKNEELKKDEMREKRNKLLKECDYRFVSDFPQSDEKKQEWLTYRQALRDFPSVWVEGMEFPTQP